MDNYEQFLHYETERSRRERLHKRREYEEDMNELPFVTVPDDYGTHEDFIYFGRRKDGRSER